MIVCRLHAAEAELEGIEVFLKQQPSRGKQTDLIAEILQLPQIVAGDDHRGAALRDLLRQQLFYHQANDGVQSVKGFVQQQVIGVAAQRRQQRRLPAHSLAEGGKGLCGLQREAAAQLMVGLHGKAGVQPPIKGGDLLHGAFGREIKVIAEV